MPIYSRKQAKLAKSVKKKKAYLSYYQMMRKAGKQPMTLYHWGKTGRAPTYYRGTKRTRPEARLRRKERKKFGMKD